jgi:FKBP-type peptidyl-prolyl cis-trans isomerase SlpA
MGEKLPLRQLGDTRALAANDVIGKGSRITMHFALSLANGEEVDSNFGQAPVTFVMGDGSLLPSFEQAIMGFRPGRRVNVTIPAEQAFGPVNEDNIQRFARHQFSGDLDLQPGLVIAFNDVAGNEQAGVVQSFNDEWVSIDFNHPLAGRDIVFTVEILSVETVDNE